MYILAAEVARNLANQFSEMPKDQERFNYIFNTALAARGLEAEEISISSTKSTSTVSFASHSTLLLKIFLFCPKTNLSLRFLAPQRQFFQVLGATKQWGETNYYKLQKEEQDANLVKVSLHKLFFFPNKQFLI